MFTGLWRLWKLENMCCWRSRRSCPQMKRMRFCEWWPKLERWCLKERIIDIIPLHEGSENWWVTLRCEHPICLCLLFAVRMYLRSVCPSNPLVFWQYSIYNTYSISIHNNFDRVYSFIMRHTLLNTTLRVAFAWQVLDHLLRILGIGSSKRRLQVVDVSPLSSTQVTTDMMGFGLSPFDDVCFFF